jgi:hypothetical protein
MFRDASRSRFSHSVWHWQPDPEPIGVWNVAAVSDMGVVFSNTGAFSQDAAAWNVRDVTLTAFKVGRVNGAKERQVRLEA